MTQTPRTIDEAQADELRAALSAPWLQALMTPDADLPAGHIRDKRHTRLVFSW